MIKPHPLVIMIDFNQQSLDLGVRTDGATVNDAILPPWAKGKTNIFFFLVFFVLDDG